MKDKEFKEFEHLTAEDHYILTRGKRISPGYSPDLTVANQEEEIVFILENERKSDRKAFLGDIFKAAYFCDQSQVNATLIIIMKETSNQTTVEQISRHLKEYFNWLQAMGLSNLENVLVMSDEEYLQSNSNNEIIGSEEFLLRCKSLG